MVFYPIWSDSKAFNPILSDSPEFWLGFNAYTNPLTTLTGRTRDFHSVDTQVT